MSRSKGRGSPSIRRSKKGAPASAVVAALADPVFTAAAEATVSACT
ncbi:MULTISPECIES: hypothetical protein [unclassified Streptomyces]|nr:hypothetical protein [Streptomyces sp. M92]WCN05089.1 hypothetical protein M6G08_24900 [Streptomyces sp. M92]